VSITITVSGFANNKVGNNKMGSIFIVIPIIITWYDFFCQL
jgi:hypothetical protein